MAVISKGRRIGTTEATKRKKIRAQMEKSNPYKLWKIQRICKKHNFPITKPGPEILRAETFVIESLILGMKRMKRRRERR